MNVKTSAENHGQITNITSNDPAVVDDTLKRICSFMFEFVRQIWMLEETRTLNFY